MDWAAANRVVVGPKTALESPGLVTEPMNWLIDPVPDAGRRVEAQIRYHHAPARATIHPRADGRVGVWFDEPQSAVTPGQSCVLYNGDRVLGGAPIAHALSGSREERELPIAARLAGGLSTP